MPNKNKNTGVGMSDMVSFSKRSSFSLSQKKSSKIGYQKAVFQSSYTVRPEPEVYELEPSHEETTVVAEPSRVYDRNIEKSNGAEESAVARFSHNFINEEHLRDAKRFAMHKTKYHLQVAVFLLCTVVLVMVMQSARIVASGLSTKDSLQGSAQQGLMQLQEAQTLIQQKDFSAARQHLESAKANFASAKNDVKNLGNFINSILALSSTGRSAQNLVDAGKYVTDAGMNFNDLFALTADLKVTAEGLSTEKNIPSTLGQADKFLGDAIDNLQKADKALDGVDESVLPADLQGKYKDYHEKLKFSVTGLVEARKLLTLGREFLGKGPKSILVLFENNNELRASGGFIGTYGFYKLNDGKIVSQKVSSIYDLDGQLKDKIAPPGPFHDLTDHWGLRDSNWFVDFPQTAKKASLFYEKEGGETPDAVIAMTPDIFVDLLRVTGAIDFLKYNLTLNADNFRKEVQLNTSELYDKEENKPKQMLADFAPLLLQKLSNLEEGKTADLFSAVLDNLSNKNIIIYDRDPQVQSMLEAYNWSGSVASTDKDYLAVFNTNLGGRKTDLAIAQSLNFQSDVQEDGSIVNTIVYKRDYKQNLTEQSKNIDYVRFLVPKGSKLISAQGFTKKPFYHSDGSDYADKTGFKTDEDLLKMDANSIIDAQSGTIISSEAGKTEFANWIEVEPGDSVSVTVKYELPFSMKNNKKYSLVVQKQPGNNPINFQYTLYSNKRVLWSTPYDLKIDSSAIRMNQNLKSDLFIGAVLD